MDTPAHYSLLQLQQHLGKVIALNLRQPVWIKAEISEANITSHGYFSLVEQDEWGAVKARSEAVLWRGELSKIKKKLGENFKGILQKGRQVLLFVQPELHEYYGLKLVISDIFEEYTIGQMELQRQQTQVRLQQAGLWQLNQQKVLPLVPQRIAVISSKEAAGLQDFDKQLIHNRFGYHFHTQLFAASVQGGNALREIPEQFQAIAQQAAHFDCVALVRGGGAKLDLAEFDQYPICEAVARCPLPVITGIGHEIDRSLADEVAHTSQKTPTAVANFLIEQCLQYESVLMQTARQIQQLLQRQIGQEQMQLQQLQNRLRSSFAHQLQKQYTLLDQLEQKAITHNPQTQLQKGFALLFDEQGQWIRTAAALQSAKKIRVRFAEEEIEVELK